MHSIRLVLFDQSWAEASKCAAGKIHETNHRQVVTALPFSFRENASILYAIHKTKLFLSTMEPFFCSGSITGTYVFCVCVNWSHFRCFFLLHFARLLASTISKAKCWNWLCPRSEVNQASLTGNCVEWSLYGVIFWKLWSHNFKS